MAQLISIDAESGTVVITASPDELKMLQQTMEDSRPIPTYLRIDKAELTIVNNEAKVKS